MMSRYEELEYLADYIPDEGESVVVARRNGELVVEPVANAASVAEQGPALDPNFYGRMVQANERLNATGAWPIFCAVTLTFWACVALHVVSGLGWNYWFLDVGIGLMAAFGCYAWIRRRQNRLFRGDIRPDLVRQMRSRRLDRYEVIGVLRQRPELRTLLDDMSRWVE